MCPLTFAAKGADRSLANPKVPQSSASSQHSKTEPTFSIIVPTYRRPLLLREALTSIVNQTDSDFECIVVSDGGDTTQSQDLPKDDRFVHVRLEQNQGAAAARNAGVREARGSILVFCDDDDILEPGRLAVLRVQGNSELTVCGAAFMGEECRPPKKRIGQVDSDILARTTPHLGATSVRRTAWVPLDESLRTCEDIDWWIRQIGRSISFIPYTGYRIRVHDGTRHESDRSARIRDSELLLSRHAQFFRDHRSAAAFRWRRIGLMHLQLGQRAHARAAFLRSIRTRPRLRAIYNLLISSWSSRSHASKVTHEDHSWLEGSSPSSGIGSVHDGKR